MSLGFLLKDIAQTEMGLLYKYSRNYMYIFVNNEAEIEAQFQKLHKQMTHWRIEKIKETFAPKEDDNGRLRMTTYKESMPCLLPQNQIDYPVVKGLHLIPKSKCNTCPHRKRFRNRPYCELLRASNKGLLKQTLENAVKTTNEIMGKV